MAGLADATFTTLFPSPFVSYTWPDSDELNKELRQRVLASERDSPRSLTRSNIGGWQSKYGALEFCGEPGRTLIGRMKEIVNEATIRLLAGREWQPFEWTFEAWANVNRVGDFNRVHFHGLSTWSGTYYVDPGDPPEDAEQGTALQLFDPSHLRTTTFFPTILPIGIFIRPQPGLMVLFPSYIPHMVFPHRGKRPRISIAFNFRKTPFP